MIELEQMKRLKSNTKKHICMVLAGIIIALSAYPSALAADTVKTGTNYPYVFVSGYCGWGQYDKMNETMQYWGMQSGNLLKYLDTQGFECYAASVDPVDSAWDRACELYAQMTGNVVDYGAVHSATYKHARFGTDYSKNPLFTGWGTADANGNLKKVNFIAHSFGGATVRLLSDLLVNGDKTEMAGTPAGEVSGLFTGGKTGWIHSITALAAPHNGTTLTLIAKPIYTVTSSLGIKALNVINSNNYGPLQYLINLSYVFSDGIGKDTGVYDLSVDGAAELNKRLSTFKDIYYFSVPADATASVLLSSKRAPSVKLCDALLWSNCYFMGSKSLVTAGGTVIDKSWFNNDGIVNTISCTAPKNEAQKTFNSSGISPGIWNIMPTFKGDHLAITGGLSRAVDVNSFYLIQMGLINSL